MGTYELLRAWEANKINVLVPEGWSNKIQVLLASQGIQYSEKELDEILSVFSEDRRSKLRKCFQEGKEGRVFYDLIAEYPLAGVVHCMRYPLIFDTVYITAAVLNSLASPDSLQCLDLGTCTGYMPIVLSSLGLGGWTGIDVSDECIQYSRQAASEADCSASTVFERASLDGFKTDAQFDVILNSRGPCVLSPKDFKKVASLLKDGGIYIQVDNEMPVPNTSVAKKILQASKLSVAYRDVVGGWHGVTGRFEASPLTVFVKGSFPILSGNYRSDYDSLWGQYFRDYCNLTVKNFPAKKTLCQMREHFRRRSA